MDAAFTADYGITRLDLILSGLVVVELKTVKSVKRKTDGVLLGTQIVRWLTGTHSVLCVCQAKWSGGVPAPFLFLGGTRPTEVID